MARAMGTNAYGKEPRRGERTLSRGFTHRRARRAFLRPYGAGASLGRSHRAYALGYFLVPLTGLRTADAQDWHDAKNSASRRNRWLKMKNLQRRVATPPQATRSNRPRKALVCPTGS